MSGSKADKAIQHQKKVETAKKQSFLQIGSQKIENVFNFKYLGCWLQSDGTFDFELKARLDQANALHLDNSSTYGKTKRWTWT